MKKTLKLLLVAILTFLITTIVHASTYYITGDGVRVRSMPKNADNVIGKLNYGDIIDVVSLVNKSWYKIKYGTGYGYVSYRYVSKKDDLNVSKTIAIVRNNTNLKKNYSKSSSNIQSIPRGGAVKVLQEKSGWAYVEYNENTGYVQTKYLNKYTNSNELAVGIYTVYYPFNNTSRNNNISKSAQKLNKIVIKDGQKFSFIKTIEKNGYSNAPEFENQGDIYGGGISQVATALYLASRDAQRNEVHVNVTEQNRFGSKTPYAKLGEEAMIDLQNNKDLVFVNQSKKDIKIYSNVTGNCVSFVISVDA